jgi:phage N-6-adenine-methyltransferase
MAKPRPAWYHEPKNHPLQVARRKRQNSSLFAADGITQTDEVDTRATDPKVFRLFDDEFHFTIDVAANVTNAKCERFYDLKADGLLQSWADEVVWCNPPYSELPAWTAKATIEVTATVVMLLPANRTEQPWWQTYVEPYRDGRGRVTTRFLAGRQKFAGSGSGGSAPFGSVAVIWFPN